MLPDVIYNSEPLTVNKHVDQNSVSHKDWKSSPQHRKEFQKKKQGVYVEHSRFKNVYFVASEEYLFFICVRKLICSDPIAHRE